MSRRRVNAAGGIPEAELQRIVIGYARFYDWRVAHFHDSRREVSRRGQRFVVGDKDAAGFLDLTLVRGPELIFAELKSDKGRLTDAQKDWLEALRAVSDAVAFLRDNLAGDGLTDHERATGVEVYVWRPKDLDAIHARLARGRVRQEPLGAL